MASGSDYPANFYAGADYGFNPKLSADYSARVSQSYSPKVGQVGISQDLSIGSMLQAASKMLNTGAKTIEVSAVNIGGGGGPGSYLEKNPKQTFKEIERLKKLAGVDLTFHGPMIEPTGIYRSGWDESHRQNAERQMLHAVKNAHEMDSKGNVVVTFHSSMIGQLKDEIIKDENGNEVIKEVHLVNRHGGGFQPLDIKPNYFKGDDGVVGSIKEQQKKINEMIDDQNKDAWFKKLFSISYHAVQGTETIRRAVSGSQLDPEMKEKSDEKQWLKIYSEFLGGKPVDKIMDAVGEPYKKIVGDQITALVHGDTYLRDSYQDLQKYFNEAYDVAQKMGNKEDKKRLEDFRSEIQHKLKGIEDPNQLVEFGQLITKGVNLLRSVGAPSSLSPYRQFAIEKSSDTFSNVAYDAYNEFKETAPIIGIENPPAGTAALDRADDLRELIETSRKKLQQKLMERKGLSESEAEKQAEKLIGATWDVGHINMIRKYGYDEADVVKEAKIIAPYVKHVHLSDNFGMEHTELPMGMGNVPIGKILELKKGFEKAKKIIEAGDWISRGGLGLHTPLQETLRAFGSPIYAMQLAPTWAAAASASGGYFSGYGQVLPEQHFSMYGAGFSNMPKELGGQMSGRSRVGGTSME